MRQKIFLLCCIMVGFVIVIGCQNKITSPTLPPDIEKVEPNSVGQGAFNQNITMQGKNFTPNMILNFGAEIDVSQVDVKSSNLAIATISVLPEAQVGSRNIIVQNSLEFTSVAKGFFSVFPNLCPVASFNVTPSTGYAQYTLFIFDASDSYDSDGEISEYSWDFGDGEKEEGKIVNHMYQEEGNPEVVLTVSDNVGAIGSTSQQLYVASPFNIEEAERIISEMIINFFRMFENLMYLDVDEIVKDFSLSCYGREHQKDTILYLQAKYQIEPFILKIYFLSDVSIGHLTPTRASDISVTTNIVSIRESDGYRTETTVTHVYTAVFEFGRWWICNYTAFYE
ncbi:MAG: PKD domain-containing protein [Candidatus Aminicenantes bacterium]|nr:PKD domain-containing protein [Candidatus Aminicenantes bacterium]